MNMKDIQITIGEKIQTVAMGTTVEELLIATNYIDTSTGHSYFDNPYIGALVNHELQSCAKILTSNCSLEPVRLFGDMGKRMYRHTICYLLCSAVSMLFPDRKLVIGHSLGDGYYFSFDDEYTLETRDIAAISSTMQSLVEQNLPIEEISLPYSEALAYFNEKHFEQTSALLSTRNDPVVELYRLSGYLDISYEPLIGKTGLLQVWELKPYQEKGMLLRYPRSYDFLKLDTYKDNPLLFSVFKEYKAWGTILKVQSLGQLNRMGNQNTVGSFIRLAEALQQKKISSIADKINEHGNVKFILIAGPSSSGKTTFAYKLCTQLQVLGKKTVKISLDNYYLDIKQVPKDEYNKPDLEALEAIDVAQFQKDLGLLSEGNSVHLPIFNFKNATRTYEKEAVTMDKRTLLVIEGIHGMNPQLISSIDRDMVFRIYISALTQLNLDDHNRISTTDNRLIRRMVRDNRTRGTNAETTLSMWPSVQRGENRYIFPYQNNADIMINSALDYELGVLAPFAEPLLKMVKPSQEMTYETARRLLRFLDNVNPIADTLVPQDSLLREFIGGSEFDVV
ncbi:uridine kinase [Sphaerochaeta pleomorpha str. Grapes]|uniref:Uridine kinase n=1 Tax=Sphaerochaeta pleomorpha (strain ATCC BAA-1885 / DSM 22778 / Grapes) TaxID=158190 RepID=G8QRX8_SPHPG|nr:nucleoside kinase [Sphaerochaeta pleomorpha]AEV29976.1 uridine kinase [Sphaerochaeta pleomorpha str. Grapes]